MLRSIKKPFKLNPQEFVTLLRYHNALLSDLPGAPTGTDPTPTRLTDYEMRMILLEAMPLVYQKNFSNAGRTVRDSTMADMESYFESQYDNDEKVQGVTADARRTTVAGTQQRRFTTSFNRDRPGWRGYTGNNRGIPSAKSIATSSKITVALVHIASSK